MIAVRKIVQIPASSSRGFSLLATNLEFSHTRGTPAASSAPKFTNLAGEGGVRIAARETNSGVVSFKVAILGGSGSEATAQHGAAQLLSSAAYADPRGLMAVRSLENIGARFSTSSDREKIVFDVTVLADRAEAALADVLSLIGTPVVEEFTINENKEAAQASHRLHAESAESQLRELLLQAAYGEESALGHSVFAHNLKRLSSDQVLAYRAAHYIRENVVVTSSGGITAEKVRGVVQSAGLQSGTAVKLATSPFVGGEVRVRADINSNGDRTTVAAAFATPAGEASKAFAVLSGVLQARGGATCTSSYSHGGLFSVYANGVPASASEQLQKVLGELKSVAAGNAPEVNAVKQKLAAERLIALEGTGATCYLLKSVLTGASAAKLADVRDVTAADVTAAAQSLLKQTPAVAVYGATAGAPTAASVKKFLA